MATATEHSQISQKFKAAPPIINLAPKGQKEKERANAKLIDDAAQGSRGKIRPAGKNGNAMAQRWPLDASTHLEEYHTSTLSEDELQESAKSMLGAGCACAWAVQELRQARPLCDAC